MNFRKKVIITIVFLFFASALSAQTVYKTKTGTKYHESECSYLSKSKIEITLKGAVSEGLTACSRCKPIELKAEAKTKGKSEVKKSSSKKKVHSSRCQATTKKGKQCKRKASAGSNYCWQHK